MRVSEARGALCAVGMKECIRVGLLIRMLISPACGVW